MNASDSHRPMPHPVCIFGPTAATHDVARLLQRHGFEVLLVDNDGADAAPPDDSPPVQALPGGRLTACTGAAGEFVLTFAQNGRALEHRASALILAHPARRVPLFARYGLRPSATVLVASDATAGRDHPEHRDARPVVVILDGLVGGSTPESARERLQLAVRLRTEAKAACHYFTCDLKVAADGVEALSQSARSAGVVFHKFTHSTPAFEQDAEGRVQIDFTDEVSGSPLRLRPDLVVVDEALSPSDAARDLARVLGLETDAAGFPQADNVHRLPVLTNRRGILVAGLPWGADAAADASNLLLALHFAPNPGAAVIDPAACVRCLTCVRVCPYGAAELAGRPRVHPAACEGCGICAAECPRRAIRIPGLAPAEIRDLLKSDLPTKGPSLTVFACTRSGGPALRAAAGAARRRCRVTVVEVPCAGGLDREALVAAFDRGADGVMVLTCHDGNCHSRTGNRLARARVEQVQAFLGVCGRGGRLQLHTTAANMPAEVDSALADFASELADRGGSAEGQNHA